MDSPKQKIVKVGANNKEEEVDPKLQRLWEEETEQLSNEGPLFYLKRPKTAFLTDFVIEFVDLGCQYVFIVTNGIGQWFYEITPSKKVSQEVILPSNTSSVAHPFFREALIRGTVGTHENLSIFLLAGGQTSEWALCHQPRSHYHQVIKIYWNLELYSEDLKKVWGSHEHPNIGHTTHLFCSNARLIDLFDALCGDNEHEKDKLCLTDVPTYYDLARYNYMRAKDSDRPMIKMVIGKSYSYRQARIEQALVRELGWRTHSDGALWVIPSRWGWLENAAKTDAPITHNNEIDSCETELLPERDTKTKVQGVSGGSTGGFGSKAN